MLTGGVAGVGLDNSQAATATGRLTTAQVRSRLPARRAGREGTGVRDSHLVDRAFSDDLTLLPWSRRYQC